MRSVVLMRPSMKTATSEVGVPRNVDLPMTLPLIDRPIVVHTVAVVVHARRGVERARRRELRDGTGRDVVRKLVVERDHRTMTLIEEARAAFHLAQRAMLFSFGPMPLPSGSVVLVALESV